MVRKIEIRGKFRFELVDKTGKLRIPYEGEGHEKLIITLPQELREFRLEIPTQYKDRVKVIE